MQTHRDQEIVAWIGRTGAATAEHVRARFGMCQSRAYARLRVLVAGGLLDHEQLLYRQSGLYLATREGLRWAGLGQLPVKRISVAGFAHDREVAGVGVVLESAAPAWRLIYERELRVREREEGRALASVSLGEGPGGAPVLHRPDLALLSPSGRDARRRGRARRQGSASTARAYARARHLRHVHVCGFAITRSEDCELARPVQCASSSCLSSCAKRARAHNSSAESLQRRHGCSRLRPPRALDGSHCA